MATHTHTQTHTKRGWIRVRIEKKRGKKGASRRRKKGWLHHLLFPFSAILFLFPPSFVPPSISVLLVVRYSSLADFLVREVIGRDSGASFSVMRYIYRRNLEHHSAAINLLAALQGQCTSSGIHIQWPCRVYDRFGFFFSFVSGYARQTIGFKKRNL